MIDFKIDKVNNLKMFDINTLEPIIEYDDISNVSVKSEVEQISLSKEKLSFNHEMSFKCESIDCLSLLNYKTDFSNKPLYVEYYIPIMVQARWHKKKRINKKWLNRYGMKKDNVLVKCDVESISPNTSYDPYCLTEQVKYDMTLDNMQYKFRPDQLRKNLKVKMCYE